MSRTEVEVHVELDGTPHLAGVLHGASRNGRTSTRFLYAEEWLRLPGRFAIEPALSLGPGGHTPDGGREIFGAFSDSAPDTWGRELMRRLERRTARREGRGVRTLTEIDYLLGVSDAARLGALRFRRRGEEAFQSPLAKGGIPPLVDLPRLLATTERVLRNQETDDDLRLLFAPGSSLGGARPKASVADRDGRLAIAKFPRESDDYGIEAWESIALRLAAKAGIRTSEQRLETIAGRPVLISRRFDRTEQGRRIPFLSALSMLGGRDGERRSYPEIVDAIRTHGARAEEDAAELFRRMVFSILVSNVDDHLRNHGFLWGGEGGWRLSPAYDLNPVPRDMKPAVLSTRILGEDGTCSIELALEAAPAFLLRPAAARSIVREVSAAAVGWRREAVALRLGRRDIERMASAFEHPEADRARRLADIAPSPPATKRRTSGSER